MNGEPNGAVCSPQFICGPRSPTHPLVKNQRITVYINPNTPPLPSFSFVITYMEEITFIEQPPTLDAFLNLRVAVGWKLVDREAAQASIDNSLYWVCAFNSQNEIVGFVHVIGDGGLYFYIQDLVVSPDYQRRGIGDRLMQYVMAYIQQLPNPNAFVGLMAAKGAEDFYLPYGFIARPDDQFGPGMMLVRKRSSD